MQNKHMPYGLYERFFKRFFDILCSILVIITLWWLYIIVAVFVRIKLGSPVLFMQERPGKNEKIFKLYKFRSMTNEKDNQGNLLPDNVRLTKFGSLLRSTSLDELPEVINILKGDMSVIGPRPLLVKYLPYYSERERHRHDVRPGLSGLAQVHGRNSTTWEERFAYDLEYVEKITFLGDIKIVLKTISLTIKREGIVPTTLKEFTGSSK